MIKNIFIFTILITLLSSCNIYKPGIVEQKKLLNPKDGRPLYFYLICIKDTNEIQYLSNDNIRIGDTIYILNRGKR